MDPIITPTLIGLAIASAAAGAGGSAGASAATGNFKKANRKNNALLAQDLESMKSGELGPTQAQTAQMAAGEQQAAGIQQAAQQRELARQQMSAQDFQQGSFAQANEQIANVTQEKAAQATAGAQDIATQMRDRSINQVRARLEAAAAAKRATDQFFMDRGIAAVTGSMTQLSGVPGASTGPAATPPPPAGAPAGATSAITPLQQ
jgi:hypothetical protein